MAEAKNKKNFFQILFKLLSYIVIAFVCAITFFLLYYIVTAQLHAKDENYRPGVSIYTIVSPSMTPVIKVYDIVVNVKVSNPSSIQIGDIISFLDINPSDKIYGQYVTHRAVNYDGLGGIVTKGDNNPIVDSYSVTSSNFLGIVDHISPFLGGIIKVFTSNNSVIFIFMIIFLLIIVGLEVKNILMLKDKDKREKEKEKLKKEILDSIKKD